jgi:hypothetical protein
MLPAQFTRVNQSQKAIELFWCDVSSPDSDISIYCDKVLGHLDVFAELGRFEFRNNTIRIRDSNSSGFYA